MEKLRVKKNHCCISNNTFDFKELDVEKFKNIKEKIGNIPYTCDEQDLMFCSPVGNQVKFSGKIKADIVLSGYSTAPDAAIKYVEDMIQDENRECKHSFNTPNMKRGIIKILKSIGFDNSEEIFENSIDPISYNIRPYFFFTQMLCMISHNGGSKASEAEKILKNKNEFLVQANSSLTAWYKRIKSHLKEKGIILLMGDNAMNLLNNSWVIIDKQISIDFNKSQSSVSLKGQLEQDEYRVFSIIHASAINWKKSEERWHYDQNQRRKEIYQYLHRKFPSLIKEWKWMPV